MAGFLKVVFGNKWMRQQSTCGHLMAKEAPLYCGQRQTTVEARRTYSDKKGDKKGKKGEEEEEECNKGLFMVVMIRHGESEWNEKNLFCGWFDAKLSEKGKEEAAAAGQAIKDEGIVFDVAHTSVLRRAKDTLKIMLEESEHKEIPISESWRLNERHYGELTGLDKSETARKFGENKVNLWRRSFDIPPPPMECDHPFYGCIVNDPRYKDEPKGKNFPMFESLKMTMERTLPYWDDVIVPQMREGKKVLVAAHGNSLRGIVKHLDKISDKCITKLNLPTGIPFVYILDQCMKPVVSMKFLGDPEVVQKAMDSVSKQGKAK